MKQKAINKKLTHLDLKSKTSVVKMVPIYDSMFEITFLNPKLRSSELKQLTEQCVSLYDGNKRISGLIDFKLPVEIEFNLNVDKNNVIVPMDCMQRANNTPYNITVKLHTKDGRVFSQIMYTKCIMNVDPIMLYNLNYNSGGIKNMNVSFEYEERNVFDGKGRKLTSYTEDKNTVKK